MKRPIRLPLRAALAVLALAPLAALAQSGPSHGDEHRPQQRQEQPQGQKPGQNQSQAGRGGPAASGPESAPQRAATPSRGASGQDGARGAQPGGRATGYDFRDQDRSRLQQHYRRSLQNVDREHRPQFEAGGEIPRAYRGYVTPAPATLRAQLPPPPEGYTLGYYQGYTVVYDPTTFVILSVIDLLNR